jgi:hypothetical protein
MSFYVFAIERDTRSIIVSDSDGRTFIVGSWREDAIAYEEIVAGLVSGSLLVLRDGIEHQTARSAWQWHFELNAGIIYCPYIQLNAITANGVPGILVNPGRYASLLLNDDKMKKGPLTT